MRSLLHSLLLAFLALASCCAALQANLAGVVDWHKQQVGQPLLVPTPPRVLANSTALLAVTKKNVLARIDSLTGATGRLAVSVFNETRVGALTTLQSGGRRPQRTTRL
jgi:hypothetical protein